MLPRAIILPEETLFESFYLLDALELGPAPPHLRLSAPTAAWAQPQVAIAGLEFQYLGRQVNSSVVSLPSYDQAR